MTKDELLQFIRRAHILLVCTYLPTSEQYLLGITSPVELSEAFPAAVFEHRGKLGALVLMNSIEVCPTPDEHKASHRRVTNPVTGEEESLCDACAEWRRLQEPPGEADITLR